MAAPRAYWKGSLKLSLVSCPVALYPASGWQLIALSNYDPPGASRMVTVLEKVLFAADPEPACRIALADPELLSPMPQLHPPVLRK